MFRNSKSLQNAEGAGQRVSIKNSLINSFMVLSLLVTVSYAQTINNTQASERSGKAAVLAPNGSLPFVVTNTNDSGDGSLRQAVLNSNSAGGADSINFDASFSTAQTILLTSGELAVTDAVTINGPGANLLTISGNSTSRIFHANNSTISISGMRLTGGNGAGATLTGNGGAMLVQNGAVTLDAVNVTGNITSGGGNGGGIYFTGGSHVISNSTFSANNSGTGNGGGFYTTGSTLSVTNSTISGNTANSQGGGFVNSSGSVTTLRSVTITLNVETSDGGGGIFNSGTLNLGNTIVAGNTSGIEDDIYNLGTITSAGFNLIGSNESVTGVFPAGNPNVNNEIVGTDPGLISPQLAPLANNGGPTPTHAYASIAAPGIDKGIFFSLTTDQRGFVRPIDRSGSANAVGGDGSDIGAYELQAPTAASVSVSGRVTTADGRGIGKAQVTLSGGDLQSPLRTVTSSFGYYSFPEVDAGQTYVVSVSEKRHRFSVNSRVINLSDSLAELDFTANP